MTNALRIGKRSVTYVAAVATILWSVGFAAMVAPLTANAADLADGDLIKRADMTTVYYYIDGGRYTFPNQDTYMTWYEDFDGVTTVTADELAAIPLTANVTFRAGTNLVKIQTDPKVYAVEPGGVLRWVTDAAVAEALWGESWGSAVRDVADSFFTNYTIGDDLDSSDAYPDGALVKDGDDYYYMESGKKRMVSSDALSGNRFNTAFAASADLSGTDAGDGLGDSEVSDTAQTGAEVATPGSGSTGGALTISGSSDAPPAGSIVVDTTASNLIGQRFADMNAVTFKANGGSATITEVTASRSGISKDSDLDEVFLMDGDTILAKTSSISDGAIKWSDSSGILSLADGEMKTLWVRANINKNASSGITIGVSIDGATLKDGGSVSGSAAGANMTVATVTDLGMLEVATSSPTAATTADAKVGDVRELGKFKFDANDQDLLVKSVKFTQIGSVESSDLHNIKIEVAGEQFGATMDDLGDDELWFDFSGHADGGLKILSGQSKFLDIKGEIAAGTDRTFAFSIQNEEDVRVWDLEYNVFGAVWADNETDFAVQTTANTTINTGTLTIQISEDSPKGNVADGASGVTLAIFDLTASGEDVKLTSLSVFFTDDTGRDGNIKNVKLILDDTQVGTTVASTTAVDDTDLDADFTFGNNFTVKAGTVGKLKVVADTSGNDLAAGDGLAAGLRAGSGNGQGKTSLTAISTSAVTNHTLTTASGVPTLAENLTVPDGSATNPTGVLNSKNIKISSFVVKAGSGEGSKISSITMTAATYNLSGAFLNMRLQHNGVDIAPVKGTLTSGTTDTFDYTLDESITLAKSEQYVVDVVVDVLSTTSTATTAAAVIYPSSVTYQTVETGQSGTASMSAGLQNMYIANAGTLTLAVAADNPNEHYVAMGENDLDIAHFKLTAGKEEPILVTDLVVTIVSHHATTAVTGVIGNIRLMDGDSLIGSAVSSLDTTNATGGPSSTAFAAFNNLTFEVPKNSSKTVKVLADVSATPDGVSSSTFFAAIMQDYDTSDNDGVKARGAQSGTSLSSIEGMNIFGKYGDFMHPLKAVLSVAHASDAPSGTASAGDDKTVAKLVFSNPANVSTQTITVKLLNFKVDTSISAAAGHAARELKVYKDSIQESNRLVTTDYDDGDYEDTSYGDLGSAADDSLIPEAGFTDFEIDSGKDRTIFVTLDTDDAVANNTLTVGLVTEGAAGAQASGTTTSQGITWTDGFVTSIFDVKPTSSGLGGLPLTGKTLSY